MGEINWSAFWSSFFGAAIVGIPALVKTWKLAKQMDGVKDELVKSTAKASLAEGTVQGIAQERSRERDRPYPNDHSTHQ